MKEIYAALGTVSVASVVEATGLYFLRAGGLQNTITASLIYGGGVVPLLSKALQFEGIGIVNLLWNIFSTLIGFVIGIYFFKERVHYLQMIGAAFSVVGIGLIIMAPKE
jgi:multidrug transporter EmrE-like cation transporter